MLSLSLDRRSCAPLWICALAWLASASAQSGGVNWNAGNAAGAGAWSHSPAAGAAGVMRPPGALGTLGMGTTDPQYGYGYAGIDARGPYGGAGGNGAYYVSGTDEHGRPFSYNGGMAGQPPMPPPPGYPNSYGYRGGASAIASLPLGVALTLALALLAARS